MLSRAVDPHSFSLIDPNPDLHSICGTGSKREKLKKKKQKKYKEIGNKCNFT